MNKLSVFAIAAAFVLGVGCTKQSPPRTEEAPKEVSPMPAQMEGYWKLESYKDAAGDVVTTELTGHREIVRVDGKFVYIASDTDAPLAFKAEVEGTTLKLTEAAALNDNKPSEKVWEVDSVSSDKLKLKDGSEYRRIDEKEFEEHNQSLKEFWA